MHVIVIGGGLIGLSTADSLQEMGARVTLLERRAQLMHGASFANSGMLHLSQSRPWEGIISTDSISPDAARDVLSLARESVPRITARANELKLPMGNRTAGCLQIFPSFESWIEAQWHYDALGIRFERGPANDFGGLALGDKPALFFPADRSGNAFDYGCALAQDLKIKGVQIHINAEAEIVLDDGRLGGVRIGEHVLTADHVVIAAGVESVGLAKAIGLTLPLMPVPGFGQTFKKPENLDLPSIPIMDYATRSCLTLFEERLHLSGTVGASSVKYLLEIWTELIPDLSETIGVPISLPWQGVRPVSLSGKPLIGQSDIDGIWVNTGHAHMGWTLSAGAGALLADMILNGTKDNRFSLA